MVRRQAFQAPWGDDAPLLPAGLSFCLGIYVAYQVRESVSIWIGLMVLAWLGALLCYWWRGRSLVAPLLPLLVPPLLVLGFLFAGGACQALSRAAGERDSLRALFECGEFQTSEPVELWGVVARDPELAPDRIYLQVDVEQARSLKRTHRVRGRVRIVVPFNDARSRLEYDRLAILHGARLRLIAQLRLRRQYRNPGAPPFDEILESQGIVATGWVRSPLLIENRLGKSGGRLSARLFAVRSMAIRELLRHFRQPASGLLVASLFGNRYFLSRDTAESFRAGGTFHLLVISGMHMAIIGVAVLSVLRRLVDSRLMQYGVGLATIWGYGVMVGAEPSVTRSMVMLTLALAGQYLYRPINGANSIAGAVIILLAWEPRDLFNPGFQVSFLTVGVIVFLVGPLAARLGEIGRWRPTVRTPWPPLCSRQLRWLAEILYWDDWGFRKEMRRERIRYRLFKAGAARWLSRSRLQPILLWVALTMLTTIAVQVALLPMMVSGFHRVSLLSPAINVVEAVLVTILMAAGALYLALRVMIGEWAMPMTPLVDRLGDLTVRVGEVMAGWPGGGWRVPDYGALAGRLDTIHGLAMIGLILLIASWNPLRKGDLPSDARRRFYGRLATGLTLCVIVATTWIMVVHPGRHEFERGRLAVTFLDVGQGDAMVVAFPAGSLMMLDSGGDPQFRQSGVIQSGESGPGEEPFIEDRLGIAEAAVMPYLWRRGIARLDRIVASHGDSDHVGGFTELVRNIAVGEAWQSGGEQGTFTRAMLKAGVPVRIVATGDCFRIEGVIVEVLSAGMGGIGRGAPSNGNNGSLVLKLSFGRRSFLLTGDVEREGEAAMIASRVSLAADVLKVAHHGSRTSSSAEFLDRVGAAIAIISAGEGNSYGHPHPEVVNRLRTRGCDIREISETGAITVSTDGSDLKVDQLIGADRQ
jgi:competence protein ComEC